MLPVTGGFYHQLELRDHPTSYPTDFSENQCEFFVRDPYLLGLGSLLHVPTTYQFYF